MPGDVAKQLSLTLTSWICGTILLSPELLDSIHLDLLFEVNYKAQMMISYFNDWHLNAKG